MANKWILFVKKWSAKNNMSYGCAISKPECKAAYKKEYPSKQEETFREAIERGNMEDEDYNIKTSTKKEYSKQEEKFREAIERGNMEDEDRDIKDKKDKIDFPNLLSLLNKINVKTNDSSKDLSEFKKLHLDDLHKKFMKNQLNERDENQYVSLLSKFRKKQLQNYEWTLGVMLNK